MKSQIIILGLVFLLVLTPVVSAEFWLCMEQGEIMQYCGGYKPDWTCPDSGGCEKCMSVYREADDCYIHGFWNRCNSGPKDCFFGGGTEVDGEAPEFDLISPEQDGEYTSRSVLVEFDLNEIADVYYIDNINGRGRWTRVCRDCDAGSPAYIRTRRFDEGFNDITFKAVDVVGHEVFVDRTFLIDSKDPKIKRTEPRRGFASGLFEVQFTEENPEELVLNYGVYDDLRDVELDIEEDCYVEKGRHYCEVEVSLEDFDGEEIEYWFELEDVVGNWDDSKHIWLDVDTTEPVINNLDDDAFWSQGVGKYNKYIYFNIDITEDNLDEVVYTYFDSKGRLKDKRLCSRLKDGFCVKKKSFKKGHHEITVQVTDEVGNSIGVPVEFDVV